MRRKKAHPRPDTAVERLRAHCAALSTVAVKIVLREGFSTENQGDRGDQKQPFDLCYSEIEGETDCSNSGYQVNSEIPLSQTEQEEPATGMLETLGPATDPSKKPI